MGKEVTVSSTKLDAMGQIVSFLVCGLPLDKMTFEDPKSREMLEWLRKVHSPGPQRQTARIRA